MAKNITPSRLPLCLQILLLTILVLVGCSTEDPVSPPTTGTIIINPEPDHRSAGWQLEMPDNTMATGNGDSTFTTMTPGTYTLTWQPVSGWLFPDPITSSKELAAGNTVTFSGTYIIDNPDQAVLIINPEPNGVNNYWRITWEDQTGGIISAGDDTLSYQKPGMYTVYWGDVIGWVTPDSVRLEAVSPDTTTFTGIYTTDIDAYPVPVIGWPYGLSPIPANFPMLISGGAFDQQDGGLHADRLTWISDRDGIVATGAYGFYTNMLSLGQHQIRLHAEDSDGLASEDTVTIQVVTEPAPSASATLTLPDWGSYDGAQESGPTPIFGWDGTDTASASGHPDYIRFLFKTTLLADGQTYAQTQSEVEANIDFLVTSSDADWSPWKPYSEDEMERRITFPDLPDEDFEGRLIYYLFVVQAWGETGAISSNWTYADNMAHFYIQP